MSARRTIAALLALGALCAIPASAQAGGFEQAAKASMSGVHKADVGFQTRVGKPEALRLVISVDPDQPLDLRYQVYCWRKNRNDYGTVRKRGLSKSSGEYRLPVPLKKPQTCEVFAYAKYRNAASHDEVNFSLTLLAKQR
jgi:hypothetical protein